MPSKGKMPTIILIVLILISLSLAGGAFYLLQNEKTKSLELQEELDDLKTKARITETKLEDSKKKVLQLETYLEESKKTVESLNDELAVQKKLNKDMLTDVEQLKNSLDQEIINKAEQEQKLAYAQQELQRLQTQLESLEDIKDQLQVKIKEMEEEKLQKVELGTIVVGQQEPDFVPMETKIKTSSSPSALEGKIIVINKDYNFVVIDLGSKDGVNINDIFSIYRKNKFLGEIKIEKVHDSMSAANFLSPDIKEKVREGDKVVFKNK